MKDLEKLIDNVKSSNLPEFPFTDAHVRTVLEDVDSDIILKNKILKGVITMTVISSLIMSIIVSLLYLSSIPTIEIKSELNKQVLSQNTFQSQSNISTDNKQQSLMKKSISFANSENKSETNSKQQEITKPNDAMIQTMPVKNFQATSDVKPPEIKVASNLNDPKLPNHEPINQKDIPVASTEFKVFDITEEGTSESDKDTVEILVLNENELENIFIRKADCGYLGIVEETYPINQSQAQMDEIKALHYPRKGHKHSIYLYNNYDITYCKALEYTGWDVEKSEGVFPVSSMLLIIDSTNSYVNRSIRRGGVGPVEKDYKIVNSTFFEKISKVFLKLKNLEIKNSIMVAYNKKECPKQKSLIEVYLQSKSYEGISHIMLTYPASKNLISLLPKRYNLQPNESTFDGLGAILNSNELKNEMSKVQLIQKDFCVKAKDDNEKMQSKFRSQLPSIKPIAGIERLMLTNEEAAQIGININNDTISTTTEDWLDLSVMPDKVQSYIKNDLGYNFQGYALLKANIKFDKGLNSKGDLIPEPIKYSGWDMKIWSHFSPACISINRKVKGNTLFNSQTFQSPWLVNDTSSAYIRSEDLLSQDSSGKFVSKLSKLVPVHISDLKVDANGDTVSNQIDFWFVASREFVMKLPERYREPILKELDLIKSIENGTLPVEDACEILKGATSYFGICSSGSSDINKITVYPNPVKEGSATVNFHLKNDKKLKMELYSSDGKFTNLIKDFEDYKSGSNTVKINLSKISSGVYLLSLTDEKNNRATVKLIK